MDSFYWQNYLTITYFNPVNLILLNKYMLKNSLPFTETQGIPLLGFEGSSYSFINSYYNFYKSGSFGFYYGQYGQSLPAGSYNFGSFINFGQYLQYGSFKIPIEIFTAGEPLNMFGYGIDLI